MPGPIKFRLGDCTIWLAPAVGVETWPHQWAEIRLRESANEWPGRDALLRLSDTMLGPDDDIDRAVGFLADAIDRGRLVAVRMPDPMRGVVRLRQDGFDGRWDEVRRLSDLRSDVLGPDRGDRGDRSARDRGRRAPPPTPQDPEHRGTDGDRPVDPGVTFVAFVVVDQDGAPLHGRAECKIDATAHVHTLGGATVEVKPISVHARIELALTELASSAASDATEST